MAHTHHNELAWRRGAGCRRRARRLNPCALSVPPQPWCSSSAGTAHVTVGLTELGTQRLTSARRRRQSLRLTATVRFVPKRIKTTTGFTTISKTTRALVLR